MNQKVHVMLALSYMLMLLVAAVCLPFHTEQAAMKWLPKSTLLINTGHQVLPPMKLFYGDVADEMLHAIHYDSNTFTLDPTQYNLACGIFMETSQHEALLAAVNGYRKMDGLLPITDYDHYEEHNGYGFLSLDTGLSSLYIIDLANYDVYTCSINDTTPPFGAEYIYHVMPTDQGYTLLSYEPESHTVNLFEVSEASFQVTRQKHFVPPAIFESAKQCTLDHKGQVYFTNTNELLIISSSGVQHIPLTFDPEYVFFEDEKIYALASSDFFLNYAVCDESLHLLEEGQANLPNKKVTLTTSFLRGDHLYTVTQDDLHPSFRNYITLYDLTTKEIVYCLALRTSKDHILLAANLP